MRMIGHVIGARPTTSTRRSVIFKSDGLELVLTFCTTASIVLSWGSFARTLPHEAAAPTAAAACFRNERRALPHVSDDFIRNLLSLSCSSTQVPRCQRCQGATVLECQSARARECPECESSCVARWHLGILHAGHRTRRTLAP